MRRKLLVLSVGGIFFLAFVFFSFLVHKDIFVTFDFNNTVRLQDHIPRRVDAPFTALSLIGGAEVTTVLLAIFLVVTRKWWGAMIAFGAYVLMHVFELFGKTYVRQLPPKQFMLRTLDLSAFPQFYVREQYSYPSGHAGRAMFVTVLIGIIVWRSKKLKPLHKYIILAVLVGYDVIMLVSRVYLGEHWTTDVIGGSLVGIALATISSVFFVF